MRFSFKNLSLRTLIYLYFGLLIVVFVAHFLSTKFIHSSIKKESDKAEVVQQLSNDLFKMVGLAHQMQLQNRPELRFELMPVLGKHENQLQLLKIGGRFQGNKIDPLTGEVLIEYQKILPHWNSLNANLNILLARDIKLDSSFLSAPPELVATTQEGALALVNTVSCTCHYNLDALKKTLRHNLEAHLAYLDRISTFFLVLELLLLAIFTTYILRFFIRPLNEIAITTARIAEGKNTGVEVPYFQNEFRAITNALSNLSTTLSGITHFVKEIGNGNLEVNLYRDQKEIDTDSLEGALISMRDQMKEVQRNEAERKWSSEGLAQFVEIFRSTDSNVTELGVKIISRLVEYTYFNQGGIYLLNDQEEKPMLDLVSLYAFNKKKFEERKIRVGEGLLGQTFLERKTTYLLEVPEDYIDIVSGLGGASPKAILIVPLMVNDEIYGVLEIASFNEYKTYEIDFIEKLCESIASTISGVKVNQRTKVLLEESQQLTQQMQAQEEEMRQNMEELTATQEEMARTENERLARQSVIDRNIGIAEFNSSGKLIFSSTEYNKQLGFAEDQSPDIDLKTLVDENVVEGYKGLIEKNGNQSKINTYSIFSGIVTEGEQKMIELSLKVDSLKIDQEDNDELERMLRIQLESLDITQGKLEEQIEVYQQKTKLLSTSSCIIILDSGLTVIECNDLAARAVHKEIVDIIGLKIQELFNDFDDSSGLQSIITDNGEILEIDVSILQNKTEYIIQWNG